MKPITTLSDGTEILGTTGDQQAFSYGGGVLYRRRQLVAWEYWEVRPPGEKNYVVYRAPVPDRVLQAFDVPLQELCLVGDLERQAIRRLARSRNPRERLDVIQIILDARGSSFFGDEPEELSPWELAARWGAVFGVDLRRTRKVDLEDFLVRECEHGYECGQVAGLYLGRFKAYEEALVAVANALAAEKSSANLYHEHEPGRLELVHWQPERHAGPLRLRRAKLPVAAWRNSMKRYEPKGVRGKAPSVLELRRRTATATRQGQRLLHVQEILEGMS